MPTSIITTDDLRDFKIELLEEFEQLLNKHIGNAAPITWLRSADVKKKLKISTSTLQNLRNKQIIKGHKIEGILFYDAAEIDKLLIENEIQNGD
ncbi:helix-turn-helix domain-containing protein [uncultured Croceitalea sp.]|uniref:helix-turn-helix domain-containing protein n=1 Tax=uncultured Croceitalea sp. TaxID=1798908 RepID=UPI00374F4C18